IFSESLAIILSNNGFVNQNSSGVSIGVNSGFVVVKKHASLVNKTMDQLSSAARIFLQKPLRAAVFVDTFYACIESASGACEEIASATIEKCSKATDNL
ncbi:hypothetical protein PMAYCL1PPCAC_19822, partial [Pristionchus mayeri]